MIEGASGSFLFESEDEAGCSTKGSGDDEEENSEWLEQEDNDTSSFPACWESNVGEENRSRVSLKGFEYQEWDSSFKSLGE